MPCPAPADVVQVLNSNLSDPVQPGGMVGFSTTSSNSYFGSGATTSGTVRIADRATPPNSRPVDVGDVQWTSGTVVFRLPALPAVTAPSDFDAFFTPAGETVEGGPYTFKLAAGPAAVVCPTTIKVGGGTLGTQAAPAARGDLIAISALQGTFGPPSGSGGAVMFQPGVDGFGNPVPLPGFPAGLPATVVLWKSDAVFFEVPRTLPNTAGPVTWKVFAQPTGVALTAACGPYDVVVEQQLVCPASGVVVGAGATVRHGSPIAVVAVGGTFGPANATAGTATLKSAGAPDVVIPETEVLWSPLAVSFTLPSTLPVSPQPAPWDVYLTPRGASMSTGCGPYRISVVSQPVLVFVPPLTVSERRADLVCTGIGPKARVRFLDTASQPKQITEVTPVKRTTTGLTVQMPTISALQPSSECDANQLTMTLMVVVVDPDSQKQSLPLPTIITLPPPVLGPVTRSGSQVKIGKAGAGGTAQRPPELGDLASCEWLGGPAEGQVRYYPATPRDLEAEIDNIVVLYQTVDDLTVDDSQQISRLEALRNSGVPLPVAAGKWHEEWIEADGSAITDQGVLVAWRNAIPSAPRLVGIDLCDPASVGPQLNQLYRLYTAPLDVPAGLPITLGVERLSGVSNALSSVLGAQTTIDFTFEFRRNGTTASPGAAFPATGTIPTGGQALTGQLPPKFTTGTPAVSTWTFNVVAHLRNLPGCSMSDLQIALPTVMFRQAELAVQPLFDQLYRMYPAPSPNDVPVGTPVTLGVEPLSAPTTNPLKSVLGGTTTIDFTYQLKRGGTQQSAGPNLASGGSIPTSGQTFTGAVMPTLTSGVAGYDSWSFEVVAHLRNIPGIADADLQIPLPTIGFRQAQLAIPTIAVAFPGQDYNANWNILWGRHDPPKIHIWLAPGTPLISQIVGDPLHRTERSVLDGHDAPELVGKYRTMIVGLLRSVSFAIGLLRAANVFPVAAPVPHLDVLSTVLARIEGASESNVVIDASPWNDDLSYRIPGFEDDLFSFFMVGLPGGKTLQLWENKLNSHGTGGGRELSAQVPPNSIVASWTTLHSLTTDTVAPAQGSGGAQSSNMGNQISASRWI
jgi:hypothetical protein